MKISSSKKNYLKKIKNFTGQWHEDMLVLELIKQHENNVYWIRKEGYSDEKYEQ